MGKSKLAPKVHHIFAYGSLMWRPDFEFVSARKAEITGYHRRLCVYSHHYRGTPEKLGLVLGLDTGGSCQGLLYEIFHEKWDEVLARVRERELLGDAYNERVLSFSLADMADKKIDAVTYVVKQQSDQYAPFMSKDEILRLISQGQGAAGTCRDYVANTIRHLRQLEIYDPELEILATDLL